MIVFLWIVSILLILTGIFYIFIHRVSYGDIKSPFLAILGSIGWVLFSFIAYQTINSAYYVFGYALTACVNIIFLINITWFRRSF